MILHPQPLTAEVFRPFGEVLDISAQPALTINLGNTSKYADLADICVGESGRAQFSIYRSKQIQLPFKVTLLERHPLGSQLFYPLHNRPFPIIVASGNGKPECNSIQAFISNGCQGINLHPNVWHHYQLTLQQTSDYIVVDRAGPGENYEEHYLIEDLFLQL